MDAEAQQEQPDRGAQERQGPPLVCPGQRAPQDQHPEQQRAPARHVGAQAEQHLPQRRDVAEDVDHHPRVAGGPGKPAEHRAQVQPLHHHQVQPEQAADHRGPVTPVPAVVQQGEDDHRRSHQHHDQVVGDRQAHDVDGQQQNLPDLPLVVERAQVGHQPGHEDEGRGGDRVNLGLGGVGPDSPQESRDHRRGERPAQHGHPGAERAIPADHPLQHPHRDQEQQRRPHRPAQHREEIQPGGDLERQRQHRDRPPEDHEQRRARRMGDPQDVAGGDEFPGIPEGDGGGHGQQIDHQRESEGDPGHDPMLFSVHGLVRGLGCRGGDNGAQRARSAGRVVPPCCYQSIKLKQERTWIKQIVSAPDESWPDRAGHLSPRWPTASGWFQKRVERCFKKHNPLFPPFLRGININTTPGFPLCPGGLQDATPDLPIALPASRQSPCVKLSKKFWKVERGLGGREQTFFKRFAPSPRNIRPW